MKLHERCDGTEPCQDKQRRPPPSVGGAQPVAKMRHYCLYVRPQQQGGERHDGDVGNLARVLVLLRHQVGSRCGLYPRKYRTRQGIAKLDPGTQPSLQGTPARRATLVGCPGENFCLLDGGTSEGILCSGERGWSAHAAADAARAVSHGGPAALTPRSRLRGPDSAAPAPRPRLRGPESARPLSTLAHTAGSASRGQQRRAPMLPVPGSVDAAEAEATPPAAGGPAGQQQHQLEAQQQSKQAVSTSRQQAALVRQRGAEVPMDFLIMTKPSS